MMEQDIKFLMNHTDPKIRAVGLRIKEKTDRRQKIIELVKETLVQVRVRMKYIIFDLEATRRERDEALNGK